MGYRVIAIDDDLDFLESIQRGLTVSGFRNLTMLSDPLEAADLFQKGKTFDIALIDLSMQGLSGQELLKIIKLNQPHTECIVVTAVDDVRVAVKCLKKGAYDYLVKPFSKENLVLSINRALEKKRLTDIMDISKSIVIPELTNREAFQSIVVGPESIQRTLKEAELHALRNMPILIIGNSGTGKELLARAIHRASPRAKSRFVPINMAAITPSLFDAEFFGHTRGAFTGANYDREGYLEYAHKGTLFLDEIGMLPVELQGKLLRFLQEGEFIRLGSNKLRTADVRIITATNADLEKLVDKKAFRKDLYYRLKGGWLHLPDLKNRKEDIPLLVNRFVEEYSDIIGQNAMVNCTIEDEAMPYLIAYDYPGNIRELKSIVHSTLNLTGGQCISTSFLPKNVLKAKKPRTRRQQTGSEALISLAEAERDHILKVYFQMKKNKSRAAKILGIALNTLRRKIEMYGEE